MYRKMNVIIFKRKIIFIEGDKTMKKQTMTEFTGGGGQVRNVSLNGQSKKIYTGDLHYLKY